MTHRAHQQVWSFTHPQIRIEKSRLLVMSQQLPWTHTPIRRITVSIDKVIGRKGYLTLFHFLSFSSFFVNVVGYRRCVCTGRTRHRSPSVRFLDKIIYLLKKKKKKKKEGKGFLLLALCVHLAATIISSIRAFFLSFSLWKTSNRKRDRFV